MFETDVRKPHEVSDNLFKNAIEEFCKTSDEDMSTESIEMHIKSKVQITHREKDPRTRIEKLAIDFGTQLHKIGQVDYIDEHAKEAVCLFVDLLRPMALQTQVRTLIRKHPTMYKKDFHSMILMAMERAV